jgi:CheY-like chemotaxis protein
MTHFTYMPGKKLLVADDSLTIQKVIRLALTNEGYEIQAVPDGTDAVQQISLFRPDVVLIDVSLPGKSAFEVKREMNQHEDLEEVRFILMSSAFEKVDEAQVEEVGFHGRLTKPFDPAHLRKVLTDGLGQVTARRMEKTLFTLRPGAEVGAPTSPPPSENSDTSTMGEASTEAVSIFPPLSAVSGPPKPPIFSKPQKEIPTPPSLPPSSAPLAFAAYEESQDSWQEGIRPVESGSLNPSTPEEIASLWEPGQELTSTLILPPSEAPLKPEDMASLGHISHSGGDDIKSLTESTIRITGLDDYQWSVNEPTLKPLPAMTEMDGNSFQVEPPSNGAGADESGMDGMPPFRAETAEARGSLHEEDRLPPSSPKPVIEGINSAQMEALVRDQVHALLEKMAQQLLPDIAEKIIKDEIHKMLSESS